MEVETRTIKVSTRGHNHIINITEKIEELLKDSGFVEGMILIFCVGSTCGITTMEYEPGLVETDFPEMMDKIAPYSRDYAHHRMWGDDNGASHLRASLIGPSLMVPFSGGKLLTGTWQQITFIDFDTRPRERKLVVQIWGKKRK